MEAEARAVLERELQALAAEFAAQLPRRLADIEAAWRDGAAAGWAEEPVDRLYRLSHSLAGAGGTFGFDAVGQAARALTDGLKAWRDQPPAGRVAPRAEWLANLGESIRAAGRKPSN